jgi:2-oxoglutarate ferredoxin oxidoreductase subunit gamma
MTTQLLMAGFGGQGILFTGKFLAYAGLLSGLEVSWLPSYGPEMRGGTANCSVILSDAPIGSPIIQNPDILLAMNLPSFDKFEPATVPGGKAFIDSSLVTRAAVRGDVQTFAVPATRLSAERDLASLANMILLGKLIAETKLFGQEILEQAMRKVVSERKQDLIAHNLRALALGAEQ